MRGTKKHLAIGITVAAIALVALFFLSPLAVMFFPWLFGFENLQSKVTFDEAHTRAVTTFAASEGFGNNRMRKKGLWNVFSIEDNEIVYGVSALRLVGLTPEHGDRLFDGDKPPKKDEIPSANHRALLTEELLAVNRLRNSDSKREELPAKEGSPESALRIMAPIIARQECTSCHDTQVGTILGAFDYVLEPKKSKSKPEVSEPASPPRGATPFPQKIPTSALTKSGLYFRRWQAQHPRSTPFTPSRPQTRRRTSPRPPPPTASTLGSR